MATQAQKWRTPPAVHGVDICEPSHSHSTGWNNHEQRIVKGVLKDPQHKSGNRKSNISQRSTAKTRKKMPTQYYKPTTTKEWN